MPTIDEEVQDISDRVTAVKDLLTSELPKIQAMSDKLDVVIDLITNLRNSTTDPALKGKIDAILAQVTSVQGDAQSVDTALTNLQTKEDGIS